MWLTKYSASGNDFLITMAFKGANRASLARKLCDRFSGIGADGFVVILPDSSSKLAYCWEFYNADGSAAKMCGNASRCVAHYAFNNKIAPKAHSFRTKAGIIHAKISRDFVEVNLGKVRVLGEKIMEFGEEFILVDSGVPHLVGFCEVMSAEKLRVLREKYNANVNCAQIIGKNTIALATFERGVEGITQACGTGMAACFWVAKMRDFVETNAILIPPHGDKLALRAQEDEIFFSGKVEKIAEIWV